MLRNFVINSAASVGGDATGTAVSVDKTSRFAIAAVISGGGSPVGVLKLQASVDPADSVSTIASTSWADVTGASANISADGCTIFDVSDKGWKWVRTVYTRSSGTGSMTTTFNENE